jgi:hypothetical protein
MYDGMASMSEHVGYALVCFVCLPVISYLDRSSSRGPRVELSAMVMARPWICADSRDQCNVWSIAETSYH